MPALNSRKSRRGATAIEYAMIAAMFALVVLSSVAVLGNSNGNAFSSVSTAVNSAVQGANGTP